jgi:hypothetical protein
LTPFERQIQLDRDRARVIDESLRPFLQKYLASEVALDHFQSTVDSINKQNEFWGFKGIKGQMFFNMVVNTADDAAECDGELKAALSKPDSEEMARSRIKTFTSYVRRIGEQHVESGGSKHGRPKLRQRAILSVVLLADSRPRDLAGLLHQQCQSDDRPESLAAGRRSG